MPKTPPEILSEALLPDGILHLHLFVPSSHPLFVGHFPGFPILPGVAQVHWAARFGIARFHIVGGISRMINLKFQKLIPPDSKIDLQLAWDASRNQLSFIYASDLGSHASGKLEFMGSA